MAMKIAFDGHDASVGIDWKKADAIAAKVARAAHAKALAAWDPRNEYSRELFAARAYAAAYDAAFHKALVKQKTIRIHY